MSKETQKLIKVIYFDETSAIDYLEVYNGGQIDKSKEKKSQSTGGVEANAKVGVGTSILSKVIEPLLKINLDTNIGASVSKFGESIVRTTISNSVLSDYIEVAESDSSIIKLNEFKISTTEESFSYIKMVTPYLGMFNMRDQALDISKMDEILEVGKGYYELIADNSKDKKILRFNIKAFRNNYHLIDLTKMKLKFYGVKVGDATLESIKAGQEFAVSTGEKHITIDDIENPEIETEDKYDLIDVVLAGIVQDG